MSEEIDTIVWNVCGKIERVVRTGASTKADLEFRYDAMGNRICKIVKPRTGGMGILDQDDWTYTYYLRDASGNVIAVYDRDYSTPGATYTDELSLKEDHLYGSSRVGIRTVDEVLSTTTYAYGSTAANGVFTGTFSSITATAASTTNYNHELKRKAYELSNHLGNVLVTVSDARTATNLSGTVSAFSAVIESASDYYAFGAPMPGRNASANSYRYGFNGKETDAETDLQDYGMRIYNPRLGKFLSIDPIAKDYPELTPYQFASNRPIDGIDLDGLEWAGVTFFYAEVEVGAGIGGAAANLVYQQGIAYDEVGKTHFTMISAFAVVTPDASGGTVDFVAGGGFSVTGNVTQNWGDETFYGATGGGSSGTVGVPSPYDIGGAVGVAVNIGFTNESISVGAGAGLGAKVSYINTAILESISLTDDQADQVNDLGSGGWHVAGQKPILDANGTLTGYEAVVYTVAWVDGAAKAMNSGVKVYSGVATDAEGNSKSNGVWMSKEYKDEAIAAEAAAAEED